MSVPALSVIICAHEPHPGRLQRVLAALRAQDLPVAEWELIVVDNASPSPWTGQLDLTWHARARVCREDRLGLTWARLCGAAAASAGLLVYVDDDNVLAPDYLATARAIAGRWPQLGVWSGEITAEYEAPPAPELAPYLELLAICAVPRDVWCNFRHAHCLPRGAGLVVRRPVVEAFGRRQAADPLRQQLGRQGVSLASGEDSDLCYTAVGFGLGLGLFQDLKLTHLIPRQRVTIDYLLRLQESMGFSWAVLNYLYDGPATLAPGSLVSRAGAWLRYLAKDQTGRRFERAGRLGKERARQLVQGLARSSV